MQCADCRLRFLTEALQDANDATVAEAWRQRFSEPIPPPLVGTRIRRRMRTRQGRAQVAAAFGRVLHRQLMLPQEE
jgi:hypothetical protein